MAADNFLTDLFQIFFFNETVPRIERQQKKSDTLFYPEKPQPPPLLITFNILKLNRWNRFFF